MANCIFTKGRGSACKSQAGVDPSGVYLAVETDMGYTYGASASNLNQITAFTGATTSFYRVSQNLNTAAYTSTATVNVQTGTAVFLQSLEFTLYGMTQDLSDYVTSIVKGKVRAFIKDRNGNIFLLGEHIACDVTSFTGGTGKAGNDLNGYTITISTESGSEITQVTAAAAATLISTAIA